MTSFNYYQNISRYTRHFFSGTLLSRVSGMLRDMSMAAFFGDHPSVAAFMVAFRFSHVLRRLLGEGALQSIFIPHYEELRLKNEKEASAFFLRLSALLASLLTLIVLCVEGALYFKGSLASQEVLNLFAWMFPSLIFICLYGLNISLLQCKNSFFSSSAAPFACNCIWIAAVFIFSKHEPSLAMHYLAVSTLLGFVVQWLLTLPKTVGPLKEGIAHIQPPLFSLPKEVRNIGKATLFGLIGVAAVQINSFLDMVFARCADLKGPVYLWYAIRLEQLPLALIGLSCVYSIVPTLSRMIKANECDTSTDLFLFGYKRIYLLVIPATFALFALGFSSLNLLFGRGNFSQDALIQTNLCLWAYGLSLLPSTLTVYLSSVFFAYSDFKTPPIASLISVSANLLCNALFVFVFHWGAVSIALSTSLSALLNYWILKKMLLKKKLLNTNGIAITFPHILAFWKLFAICLAVWISCSLLDQAFCNAFFFHDPLWTAPRSLAAQSLHFLGQLTCFISLFASGLFLLSKEMFAMMRNLLFSRTG